jgi:hypothetical protein
LSKELSKLDHPVYFMDFESLYPAVPRYKGMRPYDHIPFQWSVHRQKTLGAEPEHFEFLAGDAEDPRREFIRVSRLRWKWRRRSAVKITERTREEDKKALHRRREGRRAQAAFAGTGADLQAL